MTVPSIVILILIFNWYGKMAASSGHSYLLNGVLGVASYYLSQFVFMSILSGMDLISSREITKMFILSVASGSFGCVATYRYLKSRYSKGI